MALVIVRLQGGPDNGVELGYHVPPPLPTHINYTGSIYDRKPGTKNPVIYSYNLEKSQGGLKATRLHSGWNSLRRTMSKRYPAAVKQARRDTDAALRSLSRGRKVRH